MNNIFRRFSIMAASVGGAGVNVAVGTGGQKEAVSLRSDGGAGSHLLLQLLQLLLLVSPPDARGPSQEVSFVQERRDVFFLLSLMWILAGTGSWLLDI